MTQYIIYFNQQWVGDHSQEWFSSRGPLAYAVLDEMREAGVYVFGGGLDEDPANGFSADDTSGSLVFNEGPYVHTQQFLGGLTIIDVPDRDAARYWAGKVAQACGWPQEVREFK